MKNTMLKKNKSPIHLFKKLGKYLAISTATGDFYSISKPTYKTLQKWNKNILNSNTIVSHKKALKLARDFSIPEEIACLFPVKKHYPGLRDKNISASLSDITLNLTSKCNLNCIYCWNDTGKYSNTSFQEKTANYSREKKISTEMSIETAQKSVDLLVKLRGNDPNLVVDFYGGEPLMNLKTLLATVDYCRKNE